MQLWCRRALIIAVIAAFCPYVKAGSSVADLPWGNGPVMASNFLGRVGASLRSQSSQQLVFTGGSWHGVPVVRWVLDFDAGELLQLSRCTLHFANSTDARKARIAAERIRHRTDRWLVTSVDREQTSVTYRLLPSPLDKPIVRPMPELPSGKPT